MPALLGYAVVWGVRLVGQEGGGVFRKTRT